MKTAEQWLAIPDEELPTKLGEVLTPGPWKHELYEGELCTDRNVICRKCNEPPDSFTGTYVNGVPGHTAYESDDPCPVPDPITIDWNTAMSWRDKVVAGKDSTEFATILLEVFGDGVEGDIDECFAKAQPKHFLIAAAIAKEKA